MSSDDHIVIIGGGPVGLLASILFRQRFREKVVVIEKRARYTRGQILLLDEKSLELLPEEVRFELFSPAGEGCYVLPPAKDRRATCYKTKLSTASVRTHLLEESLMRAALKAGVNVIRPADTIDIDAKKHMVKVGPEKFRYLFLVGADGSNSYVREKILRTGMETFPRKSYGVAVVGNMEPLVQPEHSIEDSIVKEVSEAKAQHAYRVFKTNKDQFYIGLAIGPKKFQKISATGKLDPSTADFVQSLCQQTSMSCHNDYKITVFPITIRRAKKYYDLKKAIFLVGDSAQTTHFFTGIGVNIGFQQAKLVVETIADALGKGKFNGKEFDNKMKSFYKSIEDKAGDIITWIENNLPAPLMEAMMHSYY